MDDNRETLVCGIYNATTAVEAYDDFKQNIEDLSIDLGVLEVQVGPLLDLVMQLAPIDTFNAMYQGVGLPSITGDTIDCAGCGCPAYSLLWGSWDEGTNRITSEPYDNHQRAAIAFNAEDWDWPLCGGNVNMTVNIISGNIGSPDGGYTFYDFEGNVVYQSNTPPTYPITAAAVYLKDYIPHATFVAEITYT
jgi:hypothetical protein